MERKEKQICQLHRPQQKIITRKNIKLLNENCQEKKEKIICLFIHNFFAVPSQIFNQSNNSEASKNNSIIFFCELYMFFFTPLLIETNIFNQMRTS
jgi:hypothetical protein